MLIRILAFSIISALAVGCASLPFTTRNTSAKLAQKAAEGDAEAQLKLGRAYTAGDKVPADPAVAFQWYEEAALQGLPEAESLVAFAYQHGEGVTLSDEKAIEWHILAANHDVLASKTALGAYLTSNPIDPRPLAGVGWLREAAGEGDREAQALLGEVFRAGLGRSKVKPNNDKALRWLTAAAEHGHAEDLYNLSHLYFSWEEYEKAIPPLEKAIALDLPKAYVRFASMHRMGQGVPENHAESVRLLQISADFGDAISQNDLAEALTQGKGVERDVNAGAALFKKAAMQGNVDSQYNLALAYLDGVGLERDKLTGHAWLRVCTSQNYRDRDAIEERGRRLGDLTRLEQQTVRKLEKEIKSSLELGSEADPSGDQAD